MTEQEIRNIIEKSLSNRVAGISAAAVLSSIPNGPDYEKGLEIFHEMVKTGIISQQTIHIKGAGNVYVYKWVI